MPEIGADPGLVAAWLTARSISRKLPAPVPDCGGLRVDTGSQEERCRYVFAKPAQGLVSLGQSAIDPLTVLKLCASPEVMRTYLSERWVLDGAAALMTCDTLMRTRQPPAGYGLQLTSDGAVFKAVAITADHSLAASGYAVETDGVFIFDRIVTAPAHRRRGIGAALMSLLASARAARGSRFVLVATPDGRALYEALGWRMESPYTTARLR